MYADTFYYLALINSRDAAHQKAAAMSSQIRRRVITSAWVIQELADGLATPPARAGFLKLVSVLKADPHTTIVPANENLWQQGMDLYRSRPDKAWSLTDCISFEIMREEGLVDALTADHHFSQAGFNATLK